MRYICDHEFISLSEAASDEHFATRSGKDSSSNGIRYACEICMRSSST